MELFSLHNDYYKVNPKIQQTKIFVTFQSFGDLFLFGLVWQYSTNQNQYNKGRFKVMVTSLQQLYNFESTYLHTLFLLCRGFVLFVERAKKF